MNEKKISVVVPVYKVEKYLDECMESLTSQTYKNLEIIMVDDGSPDRCGQMCDEWQKKDSRIQVIHQENMGLSGARNSGMKLMTGEYVAFLDSDDVMHPKMYEHLVAALEAEDADVAICGEVLFEEAPVEYECTQEYKVKAVENRLQLLQHFTDDWSITIIVVYNKIYKRELVDKLTYPVGTLQEDMYYQINAMLRANKAVWLDEKLYGYRQRPGSIMSAGDYSIYINCLKGMCYQQKKIHEAEIPEIEKLYDSYVLRKAAHMRLEMENAGLEEGVQIIKKEYTKLYKEIEKKDFPIKDKVIVGLARYMWWLYKATHK